MGRFFITPFVPILSDKWGVISEKFFLVFEKRENVERLLKRLEELAQEDETKKREEKQAAKEAKKKREAESASTESSTEQPAEEKKGWRKRLPF
jgi:hypothetical protein